MTNIFIKTTTLLCLLFSLSAAQTFNNQESVNTSLEMSVDGIVPGGNQTLITVTFDSSNPTGYALHIGMNGTYFPGAAETYSGDTENTHTHTFTVNTSDYFVHRQRDGMYVHAVRINCGIMSMTSGNNKMNFLEEDNCIVTIGPI